MNNQQIIIIGGGPAGLAAALECAQAGQSCMVLERDNALGGILNQCIHDGFGVTRFGQSLTGPEYAGRFITDLAPHMQSGLIQLRTGVMVTGLTNERIVTAVGPEGYEQWQADAVILAMGCRERTRGALAIPGTRPAGVMTAGVAQRLMNMQNIMPGRRVVVLGSGDIGMIMARRLTLEGAEVLCVLEKLPYASGLARNVVQCLEDFDIPLHLSHTITRIDGAHRLEAVEITQLDAFGNPIDGTQRELRCDTLILSVGLIPENELAKQTGLELDPITGGALVGCDCQTSCTGIFACGNVLHVHDLVDFVSLEAARAAQGAMAFLANRQTIGQVKVLAGEGVRYCLPHRVSDTGGLVNLRVSAPARNVRLIAESNGQQVAVLKQARVHPAEMIQWLLPPPKLPRRAYNDTITISCKDE